MIIYNFTINEMNAHIQSEGEQNVIHTVHYDYIGSKESGGITYSANSIGIQTYTHVAGKSFTPYEDTEAFENVVIGWLEGSLDVSGMKASIAANIEKQIAPVNEDLYFTWQIPIPVEEEVQEDVIEHPLS